MVYVVEDCGKYTQKRCLVSAVGGAGETSRQEENRGEVERFSFRLIILNKQRKKLRQTHLLFIVFVEIQDLRNKTLKSRQKSRGDALYLAAG